MLFSLLHEALISITSSRLRTFLAMLGIVIGVSSVVLMLAIGTGSRRAIEESVAKLGSNLLIITPGGSSLKGIRSMDFSELNMGDVLAISNLSTIEATAPSTRNRSFQLAVGKENWNSQLVGTTPLFFDIRNWVFAEGESFTEKDVQSGTRVAVIGETVRKKLFGDSDPVGQSLRIGTLPFRVVGLLEAKGQGFDGRDQDDSIFVPITSAQRKLLGGFDMNTVPIIYAQVVSKEEMEFAQEEIADLLRTRHRARADEELFTVRSLSAITQTATETTKALSILLGAIASISLVVGGIGIMNIMLVTVTERTREIGIRKAIGATEPQILLQFLLEAVMIAAIGSIIGLFVAVGGTFAVKQWVGLPAMLSGWSVIVSLGVAVIVGIFSGLYPASRAGKMEPIEALRQVGG